MIITTFLVIVALAAFFAYLPQIIGAFSPTFHGDNQYCIFMDDAKARGLSHSGAMAEWRVREEFVRLRREASDAVELDPSRWSDIIDDLADEAMERLAREDAALIPMFFGMVRDLPYNHVLYGEACRKVRNLPLPVGSGLPMSMDRLAALTIVKPS